jgi:glycosyltransferase involved in cell wall biosynthesis
MDLTGYLAQVRTPSPDAFRLLYLGRISDMDKGVFFLPAIMQHLAGANIHLTIAGDGPDMPKLQTQCAPLAGKITFIGRVGAAEIPALTASHDALIMPSRFEGLPYTLIEAMATGCVPVASAIRGSTDFVLNDGATGLLFPIGDTRAAAAAIRRLADSPALWQSLSAAARADVQKRFSVSALAANYQPILKALETPRQLSHVPKDNSFEPLAIAGRWRRFIPQRLKNYLRGKLLRLV